MTSNIVTQARLRLNRTIQRWPWITSVSTIIAMILSYLGYILWADPIRDIFRLDRSRDIAEGVGAYLTVVGIVFALIISLSLQQSVERQRSIRIGLTREAAGLHQVVLLSGSMSDPKASEPVRNRIHLYAANLVEHGLEMDTPLCEDAVHDLFTLVEGLSRVAADGVRDEVDRVMLEAVLEELREFGRARGDRIAAATSSQPNSQWLILEFLALLVCGGFVFLDLDAIRLEAFLFALVVGGVNMLYFVLVDVDDPFGGVWRVHLDIMDQLAIETTVEAESNQLHDGNQDGNPGHQVGKAS